jgi:hypothetical protein
MRGRDRDEVSRSRPDSRTLRDCGRVLHLERGASPAAVRAAENAHHKQRQKKPSKFVSRSVLEGSGLLALGFRPIMRIVFLMSTTGSALALELAKSGSEAMIAVDPKGGDELALPTL